MKFSPFSFCTNIIWAVIMYLVILAFGLADHAMKILFICIIATFIDALMQGFRDHHHGKSN